MFRTCSVSHTSGEAAEKRGRRARYHPATMLTATPPSAANLSGAVWIDLLNPTDEERRRVEQETRISLPTRADIEEIESSSRVYNEGDALYLSSPVLESADCINGNVTVIGFTLSPDTLVTLHFGKIAAFDVVVAAVARAEATGAADVFLRLLEAIVDHAADALERASAELEQVSHEAFRADYPRHNKARTSEALRRALRRLGRMNDGLSHARDMLLGFGRIVSFVHENKATAKLAAAEAARLDAVRADIASLNDYQAHLGTKVQFLLDATLGFINIEQNDVVKMLTVASVVGVPPVLVAGIYGMNFKRIPEFEWTFGYPYALIAIVVSALIPLAWFKWRRWI
jgi:magnesium transporter